MEMPRSKKGSSFWICQEALGQDEALERMLKSTHAIFVRATGTVAAAVMFENRSLPVLVFHPWDSAPGMPMKNAAEDNSR